MQIAIPKSFRWTGESAKTAADTQATSALEPNLGTIPLGAIVVEDAYDDVPPAQGPVDFTTADLRSFRSNDAMAAGMMAVVLGIAFLVLLSLAVGVSVWTMGMTA